MPRTVSGCLAFAAISAIGRDDVFEAKTTSLPITSSASASRVCFNSRLSKTASMTMSTFRNPLQSVVPVTLFMACSPSNGLSRRRFACLETSFETCDSARPMPASSTSRIRAVAPAFRTETVAIPAPMRPPPRIPTLETFFGSARPLIPVEYFIICDAKKIPRSAFDSGDVTNSPKNVASASYPAALPCSTPILTASSARFGAG